MAKRILIVIGPIAILLLLSYLLFIQPEQHPEYHYRYVSVATTPEEAIHKFQCNRCHEIPPPLQPLAYEDTCVGCHQMIQADGFKGRYRDDAIRRWKSHIRHVVYAPSLLHLPQRVSPDWFRNYVQSPHVIRPHLKTMMPRMNIRPEEIELLLDYFFHDDTPNTTTHDDTPNTTARYRSTDIAAGQEIYATHGCSECHEFGQALAISSAHRYSDAGEAFINKRNAPDLQFVRERMTADQLVAFLQDPVAAGAPLMPNYSFSEESARQLAAYIMRRELPTPTPCMSTEELQPLKRDVYFDEVNTLVFHAGCRHCHSDATQNRSDGGPGNSGGFGYIGKRLDLSSYEGIHTGAMTADGSRYSVLEPNETGVPRLIMHLLARKTEVCGQQSEILGMPLALPPLSDEEIQLVWTWIVQGARKNPLH